MPKMTRRKSKKTSTAPANISMSASPQLPGLRTAFIMLNYSEEEQIKGIYVLSTFFTLVDEHTGHLTEE